MTNSNLPDNNNMDYYPSKQSLKMMEMINGVLATTHPAIKPGYIARTDGFDVDKTISELEALVAQNPQYDGLLSRLMSVSDLTDKLYDRFADNSNSMLNWFPALDSAINQTETPFLVPETKMLRLPIELAQFIRVEYQDTTQKDRDIFNDFIFNKFKLSDNKTYFIKTGTFSSKFQFANAKCSEPREMGEYFQVINNFAMMVGAGQTVDIVVREYIDDIENNPTIYNGMPLRTEFRTFVDFDKGVVFGTVPYWHPIVMNRALKQGLSDNMERDYQVYQQQSQKLLTEFNDNVTFVNHNIEKLLPNIDLHGQYSIDVMKNGHDFYVIDMALMSESALVDLLPKYPYKN